MAAVISTRNLCAIAFIIAITTLTTWYLEVSNPALVLLYTSTDILQQFFNIIGVSLPSSAGESDVKSTTGGATADTIFTKDGLKLYDGSEGSLGLHLAFLGRVYDVKGKGDEFYTPGKGYSFFAGRDATRAFITGKFDEEGLKDDVDGFNEGQMKEVMDWVGFYEREYVYVGVLQGRYYDHSGLPTEERTRIEQVFTEIKKGQAAGEAERAVYGLCRIEPQKDKSMDMTCERTADEVQTGPPRYPRKYHKQGDKGWRCACVGIKHLNSNLLTEFKGCHQKAQSCKVDSWEGFHT